MRLRFSSIVVGVCLRLQYDRDTMKERPRYGAIVYDTTIAQQKNCNTTSDPARLCYDCNTTTVRLWDDYGTPVAGVCHDVIQLKFHSVRIVGQV